MLKYMQIRAKGSVEPPTLFTFKMEDGSLRTIKFDTLTVAKSKGITTMTFGLENVVDFKPWKILEVLTHIKGLECYFDFNFTTDKFLVAFTDLTIDRLNNSIQKG